MFSIPVRLCPSSPPAPFSHKGRRGSLGVLMAETGDGAQGLAKTSTPVSIPRPLLSQGEKGAFIAVLTKVEHSTDNRSQYLTPHAVTEMKFGLHSARNRRLVRHNV